MAQGGYPCCCCACQSSGSVLHEVHLPKTTNCRSWSLCGADIPTDMCRCCWHTPSVIVKYVINAECTPLEFLCLLSAIDGEHPVLNPGFWLISCAYWIQLTRSAKMLPILPDKSAVSESTCRYQAVCSLVTEVDSFYFCKVQSHLASSWPLFQIRAMFYYFNCTDWKYFSRTNILSKYRLYRWLSARMQ